MIKQGLHTNEIVFRGHPDQIMGQIANRILHYCLQIDPDSKVGIDGCGGKGIIFLTGETQTKAELDDRIVEGLAKQTMLAAGMDAAEVTNYKIINNIGQQSPDIALGVDKNGAGDQGIVYGYAERNNSGFDLPVAMSMLQELCRQYDELCKWDERFKADGKAQITAKYVDNELIEITDFVIAYQNTEEDRRTTDKIIKDLAMNIIRKASALQCVNGGVAFDKHQPRWHINATGKFKIGGFMGDAGEIGRKIVVQQTQGFSRVGGGCTEGKDPSKVDFSGIHIARKIAQKYLKKDPDVKSVEVQIGYVIGKNKPTNVTIFKQYNDGECTIDGDNLDYRDASVTNCKKIGLSLTDKLVDLAAFGQFSPEKIGNKWR